MDPYITMLAVQAALYCPLTDNIHSSDKPTESNKPNQAEKAFVPEPICSPIYASHEHVFSLIPSWLLLGSKYWSTEYNVITLLQLNMAKNSIKMDGS